MQSRPTLMMRRKSPFSMMRIELKLDAEPVGVGCGPGFIGRMICPGREFVNQADRARVTPVTASTAVKRRMRCMMVYPDEIVRVDPVEISVHPTEFVIVAQ